ncbi:protein of unknown function DUF302 [Allomuricauda ruestringensis DSM 13258]|uniref:DUF302 domain-containing protein n=1 Tax=Allomuricauda ruestringensis (strain DSM 13258 / CIP 107369 / LMG 19739 / B1) TaxID=886377 RepID=G2PRQ8_ALLRU|nr:DUF302 domain-containing protein [Allomuricauda ruestringensis]AEM69507.1 protein of unknown function DUF302 [Allomuricauda ruestringensis DSM 13258]
MEYYFNTVLSDTTFEKVVQKTTQALKNEGFGVLTEIDIQNTLRQKLDVHFPNYTILGACNPSFAHKALQVENKIGTMLPCNVIVRKAEDGNIEVAAVNPIASMMGVHNEALMGIAEEVRDKLKRVIEALQENH